MNKKRSATPSKKRSRKSMRKSSKRSPKTSRKSKKAKPRSGSKSSKPLVFISHKHRDKTIADVISGFLRRQSLGRVEIFQSSSSSARGPEIGKNLTQELKQSLRRASVVILVYTTSDQDWSYCMWECGVAMSPDTRIILFQCAGDIPPMFQDQVRLDIRNNEAIQRFTKDYLTSTQFFSGQKAAISDFKDTDPDVIEAARQFQEKLLSAAPVQTVTPMEEWSAFPFLQVEVGQKDVDEICKATPAKRIKLMRELGEKCVIRKRDIAVEQIFGVPMIAEGSSFKDLIDKWQERNKRSKSKWVGALCEQITDGAREVSLKLTWELMPGTDDNTAYAPMVTRVRKIPSQGVQFDIYFYKFFAAKKGKQLFLGARYRKQVSKPGKKKSARG